MPARNHPDRTPAATVLSISAALLPLAVAGSALGLLLLYLNPSSAPAGWSALQLVLGYALVAMAAAVVMVLPFLWRNPARTSSWFPWAMTFVLTLGAFYFGLHASRWSFYLPPVTNRRLVTAALVLSGVGLICFYTALLHRLHRRRYSVRSLGLVTACGVLGLLAIAALRPDHDLVARVGDRTPPAVAQFPPLVVVGLDGATLEALLPLVEQGSLPLLGSWINQGVLAPVNTLKPPRPVALWTTITTGTWPFRHLVQGPDVYRSPWGIEGELKLLPEWLLFENWGLFRSPTRPLRATDLARRPLWQVQRYVGRQVEVSGWPTSGRPHPVPAAELAQTPVGTDATFVLIPDLAVASEQAFGAWAATQHGDRRADYERRASVLEAAYVEVDRALASWQATLPQERITAVVSAHGFGPQPRWREFLGILAGQPAGRGTAKGGQDGVLIIHGPGIRQSERLPVVRLVDVMPTLAHAAGLPVAADLDGEVITRAFAPAGLAQRPLTFVPSYETWRLSAAVGRTGESARLRNGSGS